MAYYKLDETTGTNVIDYMGYDKNLTNTGTADVNQTGKINTSYYFDGTNDYLKNDTYFASHRSEFSFNAWVYADSGAFNTDRTIFSFRRDSDTWDIFSLYHQSSTNTLIFTGSPSGTHRTVNSGYTLPTQQWVFVTLTVKDGNSVKIYVNGDLKVNNTAGYTFLNTMTRFYPGVYAWNNGGLDWKWKGKMDEISVFDKVLTQQDINDMYNAGAGLTYPFTPTTTISNFQVLLTNDQNITLTCTNYDLGCKAINWRIDNGSWNSTTTNPYNFLYSGAGDHNIQYFSTGNNDLNEVTKIAYFSNGGKTLFNFLDENTYAAVNTINYNISPSINGLSSGTTTTNQLDLNLVGITSQTYSFTFNKTGYGTRNYSATLAPYSDNNLQFLMLQDSNGTNYLSLNIYNSNGTTLLPGTPVLMTKNNYIAGRYLTDSSGTINPFLKDLDTNYVFNIEGAYTTSQRPVLVYRPKGDSNFGDISGNWQITLTSPNSTNRYTITTNSQIIAILPNTETLYSAKICMLTGSVCSTSYFSRTYLLGFKGLIGETSIQPYLNLIASSTLRTLKVLDYATNQPYPLAKIVITSKTDLGATYVVESMYTDSTGTAGVYLNDNQTYTLTANDLTSYTIVPNDATLTYYIYFNFLVLPPDTSTSIDVNTSNDINSAEFFVMRNTLFSCSGTSDCFPSALIAIVLTFIILVVATAVTVGNFIGVKGLSLIAFICFTIFFGIGWLPIYIFAFLGSITLLMLVVVQ